MISQEEIFDNRWGLIDVKDFNKNYAPKVTTAAVIAAYQRGDLDTITIGRHLLIVIVSEKTLEFKFQKRKKHDSN